MNKVICYLRTVRKAPNIDSTNKIKRRQTRQTIIEIQEEDIHTKYIAYYMSQARNEIKAKRNLHVS